MVPEKQAGLGGLTRQGYFAERRMQNAERRMMVSGIECETCAFWREGGSDELLLTCLLHHG